MSALSLKILIVEDNDDLREGLTAFFRSQGHLVQGVGLAADLLEKWNDFTPDVYVVDLNLPDGNGMDLVRHVRQIQPNAGIVITTARTRIGDKVEGYENGTDLYFTKPLNPAELMAGINALVKRLRPTTSQAQTLYLRMDRNVLEGPAGKVALSPSESIMLKGLILAGGKPLARWKFAGLLSTNEAQPAPATVEMRIARLRKKLATAGAEEPFIKAIYGRGYQLCSSVLLD